MTELRRESDGEVRRRQRLGGTAPASRAHRMLASNRLVASSPCSVAKYAAQLNARARASDARGDARSSAKIEPFSALRHRSAEVPKQGERNTDSKPELGSEPPSDHLKAALKLSCSARDDSAIAPAPAPELVLGVRRGRGSTRRVGGGHHPRRTPQRVARARALGSSRASRTGALRPGLHPRRTRLLSTRDSSVSRSVVQIRSAASSVPPPEKTAIRANRARSRSFSRSLAPLDRRAERALALGRVRGAGGEERQPLIEPGEQLLHRQDPDARGRELDREREVVQAGADRLDRITRAVDHELGADGPCPLREQRRRLIER